LSVESLGHQWEELADRRLLCEPVGGGVKESFDGFGSEGAGELIGEPGAAVRMASVVALLRVLQVGVVTTLSLLVRRGRRGGGYDG
jgi:hypothetical protein